VLYTGISDAPAWWIAQANTLANLGGWPPFVGLQIEYSLIERELIPMAKAMNIGVTAWSPLAGGVLTSKYHAFGRLDILVTNAEAFQGCVDRSLPHDAPQDKKSAHRGADH
jgi:aryl-alcohol dehydrogenase-like predicted oxidoreductase